METFPLNDGNQLPKLGIGVNQVRSADVGPAMARAFEIGYRSVETANTYLNERAVGRAIRDSGLAREEIYLTTKVWSTDSGYARASAAIGRTLKRLDTDYLDLLLVHQQYGGGTSRTAALSPRRPPTRTISGPTSSCSTSV